MAAAVFTAALLTFFVATSALAQTPDGQAVDQSITSTVSGRVWNTGVEGDTAYIEVYYNRNYSPGTTVRSKKNGIAEFDISSIPAGSTIDSIQLSLTTKFENGAGIVDVKGYIGDGQFSTIDYGSGEISLATFSPSSMAGTENVVSLDVQKLQELVDNGDQYFGLELDQIAPLPSGASSIGVSFNSAPVLTVSYTPPLSILSTVSGRVWNTGVEGDTAYIEVYYNRNYSPGTTVRSKKNGIAEFDISSIPAGSTIGSIQLSLTTKFENGAGIVDVKGYIGDGQFSTNDYGSGEISLATFSPGGVAGTENVVSLDVQKLQELVDNGDQYFGLELDQIAALPSGASSIGVSFNSAPVLTVAFSAPLNQSPVADAGANQSAHVGGDVFLDGNGSNDDLDATEDLSFSWEFKSVPPDSGATINNAVTATPDFTLDAEGDYIVMLSVTDTGGLTGNAEVTISSLNTPPTADAGNTIITYVGDTVFFDGSNSSDADGDFLSYAWEVVAFPPFKTGEVPVLLDSATAIPYLTANHVGDYVVRLVVSDGYADSQPSEVTAIVITVDDYATNESLVAFDEVDALGAESVSSEGNKIALTNSIGNAVKSIQKFHMRRAERKLKQAILRVDGCALRGETDLEDTGEKMDTVLSCEDQALVYLPLTEALGALE